MTYHHKAYCLPKRRNTSITSGARITRRHGVTLLSGKAKRCTTKTGRHPRIYTIIGNTGKRRVSPCSRGHTRSAVTGRCLKKGYNKKAYASRINRTPASRLKKTSATYRARSASKKKSSGLFGLGVLGL